MTADFVHSFADTDSKNLLIRGSITVSLLYDIPVSGISSAHGILQAFFMNIVHFLLPP